MSDAGEYVKYLLDMQEQQLESMHPLFRKVWGEAFADKHTPHSDVIDVDGHVVEPDDEPLALEAGNDG